MIEPRILRLPAVIDLTGLSRTTIWRYVKAGLFPAPLRLGARAVGWRQSDVHAWNAGLKPSVESGKQ